MTLLFLILVTCFLAYSNGANDNFKGVASLFGSGTTGYRRAIWWATATTFTGSIASMVLVATLTGFPVSTTHALTGAIVGAGLVAVGTGVNVQSLGGGFLLPLALSPILALVLAAGFYLVLRVLRLTLVITKEWCVCVGETRQVVPIPQ